MTAIAFGFFFLAMATNGHSGFITGVALVTGTGFLIGGLWKN